MTITTSPPVSRLEGLDFARFIAFVGMVLVNFRQVISGDAPADTSPLDHITVLMEGRAAATFVVLAGIGLGLASLRSELNSTILLTLKRAAFLLVLGLLNMLLFDADILHYYAFYFLFGVLLLPLNNRFLWLAIIALNILSLVLMLVLDYEAGWNWQDSSYQGFWTLEGFIRNLFFNGWHPVVPWLSYLLFGIVLSRYTLAKHSVQLFLLIAGVMSITLAETISPVLKAELIAIDRELADLATTEALPPMPLYMLAGMGAASVVISSCLLISPYLHRITLSGNTLLSWLVPAGRQTLTLYLAHIFLGMGSLEMMGLLGGQPVEITFIAAFLFCLLAVVYARLWSARFKHGPLEWLMRKVAG